jgi:inhibitor of Bruton tyrosine kinase
MSNLLWKYYLEDDVDRFRNLLANGYHNSQHISKGHGGGAGQSGSLGTYVGSPGASFGTSPRATPKARKSPWYSGSISGTRGQANVLTRGDLNSRDRSGLTVLHRAVSTTGENARAFAIALIEHPMVDIYTQDKENGWTALHRALYFGNVTIARALIERDSRDTTGQGAGNVITRANSLIKIKDHEGNSAFDVYNATTARRTLQRRYQPVETIHEEEEDDSSADNSSRESYTQIYGDINGDEIFAFGSNKNLTLGFGDEDDRHHPEKIILKRPDLLLHRFFREDLVSKDRPSDESLEEPTQVSPANKSIYS